MTPDEMIEKLTKAHTALCDAVKRHCDGGAALRVSIPSRPDDTDFLIGDPILEVLAALRAPAVTGEAETTPRCKMRHRMDGVIYICTREVDHPGEHRSGTACSWPSAPPAGEAKCGCGRITTDDREYTKGLFVCEVCALKQELSAVRQTEEAIAREIMTLVVPLVSDAAIVGSTYGWAEVLDIVRAVAVKFAGAPLALVALEQHARMMQDMGGTWHRAIPWEFVERAAWSPAPAPVAPPECAHGHKVRQVGCVSCVLVFDRQERK